MPSRISALSVAHRHSNSDTENGRVDAVAESEADAAAAVFAVPPGARSCASSDAQDPQSQNNDTGTNKRKVDDVDDEAIYAGETLIDSIDSGNEKVESVDQPGQKKPKVDDNAAAEDAGPPAAEGKEPAESRAPEDTETKEPQSDDSGTGKGRVGDGVGADVERDTVLPSGKGKEPAESNASDDDETKEPQSQSDDRGTEMGKIEDNMETDIEKDMVMPSVEEKERAGSCVSEDAETRKPKSENSSTEKRTNKNIVGMDVERNAVLPSAERKEPAEFCASEDAVPKEPRSDSRGTEMGKGEFNAGVNFEKCAALPSAGGKESSELCASKDTETKKPQSDASGTENGKVGNNVGVNVEQDTALPSTEGKERAKSRSSEEADIKEPQSADLDTEKGKVEGTGGAAVETDMVLPDVEWKDPVQFCAPEDAQIHDSGGENSKLEDNEEVDVWECVVRPLAEEKEPAGCSAPIDAETKEPQSDDSGSQKAEVEDSAGADVEIDAAPPSLEEKGPSECSASENAEIKKPQIYDSGTENGKLEDRADVEKDAVLPSAELKEPTDCQHHDSGREKVEAECNEEADVEKDMVHLFEDEKGPVEFRASKDAETEKPQSHDSDMHKREVEDKVGMDTNKDVVPTSVWGKEVADRDDASSTKKGNVAQIGNAGVEEGEVLPFADENRLSEPSTLEVAETKELQMNDPGTEKGKVEEAGVEKDVVPLSAEGYRPAESFSPDGAETKKSQSKDSGTDKFKVQDNEEENVEKHEVLPSVEGTGSLESSALENGTTEEPQSNTFGTKNFDVDHMASADSEKGLTLPSAAKNNRQSILASNAEIQCGKELEVDDNYVAADPDKGIVKSAGRVSKESSAPVDAGSQKPQTQESCTKNPEVDYHPANLKEVTNLVSAEEIPNSGAPADSSNQKLHSDSRSMGGDVDWLVTAAVRNPGIGAFPLSSQKAEPPQGKCKVEGCTKYKGGRCDGYCLEHYKIFEPDPDKIKILLSFKQCKTDGCEKLKIANCLGFCKTCYVTIGTEEPDPPSAMLGRKTTKVKAHPTPAPTKKVATGKKAGKKTSKNTLCKLKGCKSLSRVKGGYCLRHSKFSPQLSVPLPTMKSQRQNSLKPLLRVGSAIYAAYWPPEDPDRMTDPSWYPGVVSSFKNAKVTSDTKYGNLRFYNVNFDDGDVLKNIPDHFLMDTEEYLLHMRLDDEVSQSKKKSSWKGVKNVTDKHSKDQWAKLVGWYVASIDGEKISFSKLSDALKARDASVVHTKGVKTIESDVNLPEDWKGLFDKQEKTAGNGKKRKDNKIAQAENPKGNKAAKTNNGATKVNKAAKTGKGATRTIPRTNNTAKADKKATKASKGAKKDNEFAKAKKPKGKATKSEKPKIKAVKAEKPKSKVAKAKKPQVNKSAEAGNPKSNKKLEPPAGQMKAEPAPNLGPKWIRLIYQTPQGASESEYVSPFGMRFKSLYLAKKFLRSANSQIQPLAECPPEGAPSLGASKPAAAQHSHDKLQNDKSWTSEETELIITLDEQYAGYKPGTKYNIMAEKFPRWGATGCRNKVMKLRRGIISGKDIKSILGMLDIKRTLAKWTKQEIDQLITLEDLHRDQVEDEKNKKIAQAIPRWSSDNCSFKTLFMRWETRVLEEAQEKKKRKEKAVSKKRKMEEEAKTANGVVIVHQAKKQNAAPSLSEPPSESKMDEKLVEILNKDPYLLSRCDPQTLKGIEGRK